MKRSPSDAGEFQVRRRRADITELLETWARYRIGRIDGGTGMPSAVLLGRLLDGMPGTDCGRCKDAVTGASVGYIYVNAPGIARQKVVCPVCDGRRRVKLDPDPRKTNPACIRGSGHHQGIPDDPVSQRIDWLICTALTQDQREVVMAQYTKPGTQEHKASRMGISQGYLSRLLGEAYNIILAGLG